MFLINHNLFLKYKDMKIATLMNTLIYILLNNFICIIEHDIFYFIFMLTFILLIQHVP